MLLKCFLLLSSIVINYKIIINAHSNNSINSKCYQGCRSRGRPWPRGRPRGRFLRPRPRPWPRTLLASVSALASELSGLVKMVEAGSRPPNFFQFKCVLMFQTVMFYYRINSFAVWISEFYVSPSCSSKMKTTRQRTGMNELNLALDLQSYS